MLGVALVRRACPILTGLLLVALGSQAGVSLHARAELAEANRKHAEFAAGVESRVRRALQSAGGRASAPTTR